jgi:hypothetical protein|tara:strand:+ start:3463 stop:3594 length:132 start_codon:yes stop_codon:yes gene_type:complete
MNDWQKWVIVLAGLVALVGHWVTGLWLDVIGGAVAAIVGLMLE